VYRIGGYNSFHDLLRVKALPRQVMEAALASHERMKEDPFI
jgi:hypothetical protein